jgi:hypothetical protein
MLLAKVFVMACQGLCLRSGVNKGRIERIHQTLRDKRYTLKEIIRIRFSVSEMSWADGGATARRRLSWNTKRRYHCRTGTATRSKTRPVEPPPLTARVNMNDPMMTRIIGRDHSLPTTIPTKEMLKKMPLTQRSFRLLLPEQPATVRGCVGRGCFMIAPCSCAYPVATAVRTATQHIGMPMKPQGKVLKMPRWSAARPSEVL